jgi:hypothetical protein
MRSEQVSNLNLGRFSARSDPWTTALPGTKSSTSSRQPESARSTNSINAPIGGDHSGNSYGHGMSKINDQPLSSDNTSPNLKVGTQNQGRKLSRQRLACPVWKHDEFHDQHRSCRYKGGKTMSDIKTHMQSNDHRLDFPFIRLCRNCWEYIIDSESYRGVHETKDCLQTVQQRGEQRIVAQWKALYGTMYPHSARIPSPCKSIL